MRRDEAFGGANGVVEVAAAEAGAGDAEFAGFAFRERGEVFVADGDGDVRNFAAEGDEGAGVEVAAVEAVKETDVGAFGGTVGVDDFGAAVRMLQPGAEAGDGDGFAAENGEAEGGERGVVAGRGGIDEGVEGAGGAVNEGDAVVADEAEDTGDVVGWLVVEDETAAGSQRGEEVFLGEVEAGGADNERAVVGAEGEFGGVPVEEVGEAFAEDRGGFRLAGGPGGEDGVERGVGTRRGLGQVGEERSVGGGVDFEDLGSAGLEEFRGEGFAGDDEGKGGGADHVGQPGFGVGGVERDIGRAGLHDGEQGGHEVEGTVEADADEDAGAAAEGTEVAGEEGGSFVEFGGGEGGAGGVDAGLFRGGQERVREFAEERGRFDSGERGGHDLRFLRSDSERWTIWIFGPVFLKRIRKVFAR